jgi:O-antigen ligase
LITPSSAGLQAARGKSIHNITERLIQFSLLMYALFAPHSIAITQGSFLLGAAAWGVQMLVSRESRPRKGPADVAILGFFACCVVSSFFSYAPLDSIKGLRSPAFFIAFFFVTWKVASVRFARILAIALVASCLLNVAYSGLQLLKGRGARIEAMKPDSPLLEGELQPGDVILEADSMRVDTAEDLSRIVDSNRGRVSIKYQRTEAVSTTTVSRRAIKQSPGEGAERLGVTTSPGRHFRVTGLYNHYETYAEVLQMIASLGIGLLIAYPRKRSGTGLFLAGSILLIAGALILTSTRAPIAGLALSAIVMAIVSFGRRAASIAVLLLIVLVPAALFVIERSRGISFIDLEEGSTAYRLAVWREAFGLIKRHPLLGIGKGSEGTPELRERFGLYELVGTGGAGVLCRLDDYYPVRVLETLPARARQRDLEQLGDRAWGHRGAGGVQCELACALQLWRRGSRNGYVVAGRTRVCGAPIGDRFARRFRITYAQRPRRRQVT